MSHVDEGTLTAYADGALDAAEKKRVDAHLAACSACRAVLEEAKRLATRSHEVLAGAASAFAPPPTFDELVARSKGSDDRKGLEGMSKLAWAASLTLAIGLGWYARGIVRQQPGDLSPAGPVAAKTSPSIGPSSSSLTPDPSPRRGEGGALGDRPGSPSGEGGRRDRLASEHGGGDGGKARVVKLDRAERDVKAEGRSIEPNRSVALQKPADSARVTLRRPADSARADVVADMAKTASGAGTGAGNAGAVASGVGEPRARAPAPLQLQAAPRAPAIEPTVHVLIVPGLNIIRRRAIVPGSDVMRTVQSIDATHELELIQEPLAGERRRVPGDTTRLLPGDSRSAIAIERDGYRITGRAKISVDSLRVLLSKLH